MNLATFEDIEQITRKIESAKQDYNFNLENLKHSLDSGVFKKNHFLEKSTVILLDFYDTIIQLFYDNLARDFGNQLGDMKEGLVKYQIDTQSKFLKLKVDYHRLIIFMDGHSEVMMAAVELLNTSIQLNNIFDKSFGPIKIAIIKESESSAISMDRYKKAVDETNTQMEIYNKLMRPQREVMSKQIGEFIAKLMNYLKTNNV